MSRLTNLLFATLLAWALPACAPVPAASAAANPAATARQVPVAKAAVPANLPLVTVRKSPTCGCCQSWVEHIEHAGFPVRVIESDDLAEHKEHVGVPGNMASCHTAEVSGYFIEGHVPARDIFRLVDERPAARGLAVPGMPMGSPGMGDPAAEHPPYTVFLVAKDGTASPYSQY